MSNQNKFKYRQVGDYLIPNLVLPPEEANILFATLLTEGKLYQHCADIEKQAQQMFDTLVEQMKATEGVTEQLKEENQIEWLCRMKNIESRVRETICKEFIYIYDSKTEYCGIK